MSKKQRLELTWIGKDERPRLEPRVLIEDAAKSHHAAARVSENDIFDNRLIFGDNLLALQALEQEFTGKIKCIYIDPPFNTQQAFEHYDDGVEHSLWLQLMRDRIALLYKLLSLDGSFFVHIDDNELGYLIALVDEIFGRSNRISVISFKQSAASGPKSINPGLVSTSNFILYYVKDRRYWKPNRVYVPIARDARYNTFINNYEDHYSRWSIGTLRAAFADYHKVQVRDLKSKFGSELERRLSEFVLSNADRVVQPALVRPEDINVDARGALFESSKKPGIVAKSPREGRYFLNGKQLLFYASKTQEIDGQVTTTGLLTTIWDDLFSNNLHKEGSVSFPNGKKPEALIKRLLELSTNDSSDWILDSFAGSGTTGAVAQKMRRRWIMVELLDHCHTHIIPRLTRVVEGEDPSGVTDAVQWKGGGGFRYYRLAPSLLKKDRWGNWIISDTYNPAMLAEAVCKLMGFTYAPSETEYWMHGRSSERDFIYVTTQSLTASQLRAISEEVGDERSLLICCAAFRADPNAFPNLSIRKIPQAVLRKCEWGKDDYSLNIANLPMAEVREEPHAPSGSKASAKKEPVAQTDLFAAEPKQ